MPRWLFAADLHGHPAFYAELERLTAATRPEVVVLGGDLAPHGAGEEGVGVQRTFFLGLFRETARRLLDHAPGMRLFMMLGNDDWRANLDVLEAEEGRLWSLLHGRAARVAAAPEERYVAGLSWVPVTPFPRKDWDRWDTPEAPPGRRLDGFTSGPRGLSPVTLDGPRPGETIADALAALGELAPPERTVYCLHSPPYGTACDRLWDGSHCGSRAARAFIERHQPPLVLSGHIHESPRVSGSYRDRIGRTLVVNPGQFEDKRFCAVTFDLRDPEGTMRHTVRG